MSNVTNVVLGLPINPVKKKNNESKSDHFNQCFGVLKDVQQSTGTGMCCMWWNVVNVGWNDVGVLDWDRVMHVWLDNRRRVFP